MTDAPKLSARAVATLTKIASNPRYLDVAREFFPSVDRWKSLGDADLWRRIVSQVCVVGNEGGWKRLAASGDAAEVLSPDALLALTETQRASTIHAALRRHGVRYVTNDPATCRKTAALVENLEFLRDCGGAAAYLARVAALPDDTARVKRISRDLRYIKHKGARDFLIELDLGRSLIAFDVRLINVLVAAGVRVTDGIQSQPKQYDALQRALVERVCVPAGVTGAQFDRILFRNYPAICAELGAAEDGA